MPAWKIIDRDTRDMLGEGTLWSARDDALYWVDILAPAVQRLRLRDGTVARFPMPEPVGWLVERARGGFVAGLKSGFAELDLEPFAIRHVADPEPEFPDNRMNDGKADRDGNIWCGTMDMREEHVRGALYRMRPDRSWAVMDRDYMVTNGPAFSPGGEHLYHNDTVQRIVYRFRVAPDGGLSGREIFIRFDEGDGYPDGMTTDAEGGLWIAHWGGSRISRFRPDGSLDRAIALPARQVTNMAFGGAGLDRLFVTSARVGLNDPADADGALFEVETGVKGVAPGIFPG